MNSRTAVIALVAFILIATAGAGLIVRLDVAALNETAAAQAAEAPEIARLFVAKYGTLERAAPSIVDHVTRQGLFVVLADAESRTMFFSDGRRITRRPPQLHPPDAGRPDGGFEGGLGPLDGPGPRPIAGGGPDAGRLGPAGFADGPGGPGSWRRDWLRISVAMLAGVTSERATLPGGWITIAPGIDPIFGVVRGVAIGLALVLLVSGVLIWLTVRSVRRAALRPLHETTLALQQLALRDFSPRTIMAGGGSAYDELARAYNAAVEAVSSAFAERRAAEAEMQRFIADAGHELRTPLTIVMGYLDIIDGGALADPKLAGRVTSGMRTEAVRMRKLVDKLIVLARMETPSDNDARTDLDVVSLVARVIESLEPLALQPMEVMGAPFAHVFANEDDVADALINIIENALKYAPGSPVTVTVDRRDERIVIDVTDRGPGMSAEEQRDAFERSYRGEKRGEVTGSGLGLAIAKRAIERAGGTIDLRSAVGTGTTVTIELPEMPIALDEARSARLARR